MRLQSRFGLAASILALSVLGCQPHGDASTVVASAEGTAAPGDPAGSAGAESAPERPRPQPLGPAPPPLPEGVPPWTYEPVEGLVWADEVPLVLAALYSSDPDVRLSGAGCARQIASAWASEGESRAPPAARAALADALAPRLGDESDAVRLRVAQSLQELGRTADVTSVLQGVIESDDPALRFEVVRWLCERPAADVPDQPWADVMASLVVAHVRDEAQGLPYAANYLARRMRRPAPPQSVVDAAWCVAREGTPSMRAQMAHGWLLRTGDQSEAERIATHLMLEAEGGDTVFSGAQTMPDRGRTAIPALARALAESRVPHTRERALSEMLCLWDEFAEERGQAIRQAFAQDEIGVLRAFPLWNVWRATGILPPDALRRLCSHRDADVRHRAAVFLAAAGERRERDPLLDGVLSAPPTAEAGGMSCLTDLAKIEGAVALPRLEEVARTGRPAQRAAAAQCIAALAQNQSVSASKALVAGLADEEPGVRAACAGALWAIDAEAHAAALSSVAAGDADPTVALAAVRGLIRCRERRATGATEGLLAAVDATPHVAARAEAIHGLGGARGDGDPDDRIVERLVALLADRTVVPADPDSLCSERTIGEAAARALTRLCGPREDAARALACLIDTADGRKATRDWMLGELGAAVVPALHERLCSPDPEIVAAALRALGWTGQHAVGVAGEIVSLLGSDYPIIRSAAAFAVTALGPQSVGAVPQLRGLLRDPSSEVAGAALQALRRPDREPYRGAKPMESHTLWWLR